MLINTFYNAESTGKLIHNFHRYLRSKNIETRVLYGHGSHTGDPDPVRLSSPIEGKLHNALGRITGMNCCFSPLATAKALKEIDAFQPDLVYLGNLHGHYINLYRLYDHLREKQIPIVQILWDEYMMTGACAFSYECEKYRSVCGDCPHQKDYPISLFFDTSAQLQKMKHDAYRDQDIAFAGVPYTADKARHSSLLKGRRIIGIDEAVDQDTLFFPKDPSQLRNELKIPETQKVILNVCPYPSIRKGGKYYLELARSCLDHPELTFVHVGFKGSPSECPENFIPIGYVSDQNRLSQFYSLADLFVCTSLAETQPNTCIEALSCGTHICGFDISGVPTCAPAPFGSYVPPFDTDALKEVVLKAEKKTPESIRETRAYAETRFSSQDYNERLLDTGLDLLSSLHPEGAAS